MQALGHKDQGCRKLGALLRHRIPDIQTSDAVDGIFQNLVQPLRRACVDLRKC